MTFWLAAVGELVDLQNPDAPAAMPQVTPGQYVVAFCMLAALCVGFYQWYKWLRAIWQNNPAAVPTCFQPRPLESKLVVPTPPFVVAICWVGLMVVLAIVSTQTRSKPNLEFSLLELASNVVGIPLVIGAFLLFAWKFSGLGTRFNKFCPWNLWKQELAAGLEIFFLAIPGILVLGIVSLLWRDPDNVHVLLQMLQREITPLVVIVIVLGAAVFAPLFEELLFRVVLQNGLITSAKLSQTTAVWLVAILFALAHGVFDALQLIPLALLLGWSMAQRQSYLTLVAAHAIFNSFMLTMTMLQTV